MNIWGHKDAIQDLHELLEEHDVAQLRTTCRDWQGVVDSTLSKLAPINLDCALLKNRTLPSLRSLHITQLQYLEPQQLQQCSSLTRLTELHIGGTACSRLRTHHLAWVGRLTGLQDLCVSKCGKVKLSVVACWHGLTNLKTLTLIGLSVNPADSYQLYPFLAAGAALNLTSLVLGDQQGLSFLNDSALQGLGALLGPVGKIRVLDLSGCIELTDFGIRHLSGLTSLEQISLHNCMKIGTGATQTLATFTNLKTLNLRGCSQLTDTQVSAVTKTLTQLETLNLQTCSGLTGVCLDPGVCKGLGRLRSVNLSYCQGLQPAVLEGLAGLANLQGLDLTGCRMVTGFEVLCMLGKLNHLTSLQAGYWRCRTAAAAAGSTGSSSADGGPVAAATPLLPPKLRHLNLSHLSCTEAFLKTLTSHFPKTLTHLDLTQCLGFGPASDPTCLQGLANLTLLQTLKLDSGLGGMAAAALGFMSSLTNLRDLKLVFVHDTVAMTDEMVTAAVGGSSSSTVQWLQGLMGSNTASSGSPMCSGIGAVEAAQSGKVRTAAAATVAADNPQQQRAAAGVSQLLLGAAASDSLAFSSSSKAASQVLVRRNLFPNSCSQVQTAVAHQQTPQQQQQQQHWLCNLQQLENLSVMFSPWMTDEILQHLSGLSRLTSLNLTACQYLTGSGFQAWNQHSSSSSCTLARSAQITPNIGSNNSSSSWPADLDQDQGPRLRHDSRHSLTQINLTGCGGLTDQGLAAAVAACPRLQELLLPGCRGIGDEGVEQLGKLSRLRDLDLASNKNITARSVAALCPKLNHLKTLSLSLCGSICDDALPHIAAAPNLAAADLRGCWQITDQGVYDLLSNSRSLLQLNVDSCHRLSSRCCPDYFRPGGVPLPAADMSSSCRPGMLVRVAMDAAPRNAAATAASGSDGILIRRGGHTSSGQLPANAVGTAAVAAAAMRPPTGVTEDGDALFADSVMTFELSSLQAALQQ